MILLNPSRFASGGGGGGNGLLTNLVSYWTMDETSGTRVDSHGTNDLTDNNTVSSAAGKFGNAASFVRANSEFLSVADNASLSITSAFSISFWVRFNSSNVLQVVASKQGATGNRSWQVQHTPGNRLKFIVYTSSASKGKDLESSVAITTASWYHVVCTFIPSTAMQITVNGTLSEGTDSIFPAIADSSAQFRLGYIDVPGAYHLDGELDEIGIWSRALSSTDRTNLYNSGSPPAYASFT